jgi:uncharacterized RDD family membrane protein YckC
MQDANERAEELEYVGFWARFLASIIDTILMAIVLVPFGRFVYEGHEMMYGYGMWMSAYNNFWTSIVLPAVVVVAFWVARSATPGKMAIGAKIVDAKTGGAPTLSQHVIRYLGYYLSAIPFCLGFLWVAFDSKKQGWHDKLAGTVVVRAKRRGTEPVRFEQQTG